jgi:hypothetical protein
MKHLFVASFVLAGSAYGQLQRTPISENYYYPPAFTTPQVAPEIRFDTPNPDYFVLPNDWNFGEISSVATNSKGHVFVLSRSDTSGNVYGAAATQLFEFDEKGKYMREIGHALYGFAYGHGLRVDKDDNIWVVDKGTNMVIKFSNKTGKVMMVLGRRDEPIQPRDYGKVQASDTTPEAAAFKEPTDVAWDSKGNIYVSDGYGNSRVAKFDNNGRWLGSWGKPGFGPGEFSIVHNVVVDKNDHVWVADRSNGRIQVFDTEGNFLKELVIHVAPPKGLPALLGHEFPPPDNARPGANFAYRPGTPDALCIPPDNPNVMFVADLYPGRIYKIDLDGKVLGYFGHSGKLPGEMGGVHGIACPTENLIYTGEFINWRAQRFVLHPSKVQTSSSETVGTTAQQ